MTLREFINQITDNDFENGVLDSSAMLDRKLSICLNDSNSSTEMEIQEIRALEKIYIAIGREFHR